MMRRLDEASVGDHLDRLYRAALGLTGSREDAEDLVQDTYAQVLAKPRFLRKGDDLAYLMSALRNTFLSGRRAATRRPKSAVPLEDIEPADPYTGRQPDTALANRELFAAIGSLPDDFRLALVAVDIVGLSYRETARAMRVPEATIATRVHRARQRVGRLIETEDDERRQRPPALPHVAPSSVAA